MRRAILAATVLMGRVDEFEELRIGNRRTFIKSLYDSISEHLAVGAPLPATGYERQIWLADRNPSFSSRNSMNEPTSRWAYRQRPISGRRQDPVLQPREWRLFRIGLWTGIHAAVAGRDNNDGAHW